MDFYSLGWGSLVWDSRELPLASDWIHDGPSVPVEFARQSQDGRITLVVSRNTKPIPVFSAKLRADSIEGARQLLAAREGVSKKYLKQSIGWWSLSEVSEHAESSSVGTWAKEKRLAGVVWTALKPRFDGALKMPSSQEVIKYLNGLGGKDRQRAKDYVCRTPPEIRTVYRDEIEKTLGWMPE